MPAAAVQDADALRSVHTSNLPAMFEQAGISLVVSTYQAGKAVVVRNDRGVLNTHFRTFKKPMGVAASESRLTIGGASTVWEYRNMPAVAAKLDPPGRYDACYLPRRIHVTGDIDVHELAWDGRGDLWVVNTRFGCLCTLDPDHSFYPRWRPPFVSALAPEDRCHLNGLAMVDGRPRYVTALGATDTAGGWRANKARGGILMDVESNAIVLRGLSMPHSPRWYRGKLWILESGEGTLALVDVARGTWQTVARLPGFTRGLDFVGPLAFVGLSQVRESAVFSGIPLVERLSERACGVWVVNIDTGQVVGFLRFEEGVQEVFAVQALRGVRYPEILEWDDEHLAHSYVLPDEAIAEVALPTDEALERSPDFHFRRGNDLYRQGKVDEAIVAYRRCLALDPHYPNARYNCGVALGDAHHYAEAVTLLEDVIRAEPERAEVHTSLGYVAALQRQPAKAIACWERAIELQPRDARAHVNLAMTLLQLGDYRRGFAEWEWRPRPRDLGPLDARPRWDGNPIPGRTLLIHTDGRAKDAIQLARYLPMAARRCGTLVVACEPELQRLMSAVPGVARVARIGAVAADDLDAWLPLLSLPHVFGTTVDTVPGEVPYLDAAALRGPESTPSPVLSGASPRVGIAWGADSGERDAAGPREDSWRRVLGTAGIAFYGVQRAPARGEIAGLAGELQFVDLGDLAAIFEQLDLVVGVDGPVVHLAGALGKRVWTLLGDRPDWRWTLEGETTPWYPTMRLYRQSRPDDWADVMDEVGRALSAREWAPGERRA